MDERTKAIAGALGEVSAFSTDDALIATQFLAALRAAGYAVVPLEPTPDMMAAGQGFHGLAWTWRKMLAAAEAPKPEETTGG